MSQYLLEARELTKNFPASGKKAVHAVSAGKVGTHPERRLDSHFAELGNCREHQKVDGEGVAERRSGGCLL